MPLETVKLIIYPISKPGVTFSEIIFFPFTITEWNKLNHDMRNSDSLNVFNCFF